MEVGDEEGEIGEAESLEGEKDRENRDIVAITLGDTIDSCVMVAMESVGLVLSQIQRLV